MTFAFVEKNGGNELEFVGWPALRVPQQKPRLIRGFVNPWGCEIAVVDLKALWSDRTTRIATSACIIIFEYVQVNKFYFGILVDELKNVINVADGTVKDSSPLLLSARRYLSNGTTKKS